MNSLEISILDFIREHLSSGVGDVVMPFITAMGDAGIIWIAMALVLLVVPKTRKYGLMVALSLLIESVLCNLMIKPLVARVRPFDVNTAVELLVTRPRDYSFPSGHTGASFAAAASLFFGKAKGWIPVTVVAILIGFSRLYLYVHYPTDVLAGAILGVISGYISVKIVESRKNNKI